VHPVKIGVVQYQHDGKRAEEIKPSVLVNVAIVKSVPGDWWILKEEYGD
jgi:hypothetical protein